MKSHLRHHKLLGPAAILAAAALPLLSGCAGFTTATPDAAITQTLHMTGSIHGGQQPVSGAKIYLYSVGTYNNSPSTSMLTGTGVTTDGNGNGYVTSNANGGFTITGDYTCPTGSTAISTYLLALGGNPGLTSGTSNSAISLIAALGPCSSLSSSTFVVINEVSTAAAVTALQQFMTDSTHIFDGSVSAQPTYSMPQGIPNAMLNVNNMVSLSQGLALAAPAGSAGVAPQAKLNTLGNILASCINTSAPTSTQCAALFAAATPTGGTAPTDTVAAMLNIAKNPGLNVSTLYGLSTPNAPFQPAVTTAPNDLTLGITYTAGLSYPGPLAIDNSGDVFVANCPTCNSAIGTDSVVGFSPAGVVKTGTAFAAIHKPTAIAVDRYNSVWITESASATLGNQVTRISNDGGTVQSGFPVTLSGVPGGMAIVENSPAAAWITDSTNGRMALVNSDGTGLGSMNTTGIASPTAIAADGIENLFLIGAGSSSILEFTPIYNRTGSFAPTTTNTLTTYSGTAAGVSGPSGLAIDGADHLWTVDTGTKAVSEILGITGAATSPAAGYTGINTATNVTIDGAGTAWIANCRVGCTGSGSTAADNIVHLSTAGASLTTSSDGLQNASLSHPTATAIDLSGDLWISNTSGASVTELVGVAVPVVAELETASSRHALPAVNYLKNPSFELGSGSPSGWTVTSTASGSTNEDTGSPFSGQQKLTYYNGSAFTTTTSQTITGLTNGNYLATCYIASGPGSTTRTTSLLVSGYGGTTLNNSPSDLTYTFQPYSISNIAVTTGTLTLGLYNNETYTGGGYAGWDSCSVTRQ